MTHPLLVPAPTDRASAPDLRRVQRRTLVLLSATQVVGGVGIAIGIAVGALLAARLGGTAFSGLAQSALVVGGALLAVPVTRLMRVRGRRPGLVAGYLVGTVGAVLIIVAAASDSLLVLLLGLLLFGGGNTAGYQARYAAVDLATPARRGRQLSLVVWATTVGAVAGPNLAPWADSLVKPFGLATYSGPFVVSVAAFLVAATALALLLRPDPLLVAMAAAKGQTGERKPGDAPRERTPKKGMRAAVAEVRASADARLGIASVAVGHVVMVGVMSMTPVYIGQGGHGDVLRIVGIVLSLHIAGMYALSPVTGWLTDRLGRRPVILGGVALLVASCAIAGTAGHETPRLALGLTLLGLGWSGTMVAGSTLLSESVGVPNRPSVQGLSDLVMGLSAATAGAIGGVVVAWSGYPTLTLIAAVATVPLVALALRPRRLVEEG